MISSDINSVSEKYVKLYGKQHDTCGILNFEEESSFYQQSIVICTPYLD